MESRSTRIWEENHCQKLPQELLETREHMQRVPDNCKANSIFLSGENSYVKRQFKKKTNEEVLGAPRDPNSTCPGNNPEGRGTLAGVQ